MNYFEEYFKAGEPGRRERAEARASADDDVNHGRRAGEGLAKGVAHADSFPENRERGGDENGRIAHGDESVPDRTSSAPRRIHRRRRRRVKSCFCGAAGLSVSERMAKLLHTILRPSRCS